MYFAATTCAPVPRVPLVFVSINYVVSYRTGRYAALADGGSADADGVVSMRSCVKLDSAMLDARASDQTLSRAFRQDGREVSQKSINSQNRK